MFCIKVLSLRAFPETSDGCTALHLLTFSTLTEDLSLIPKAHIRRLTTACTSSSIVSTTLFWFPPVPPHTCSYTYIYTSIWSVLNVSSQGFQSQHTLRNVQGRYIFPHNRDSDNWKSQSELPNIKYTQPPSVLELELVLSLVHILLFTDKYLFLLNQQGNILKCSLLFISQ